MQKLLFIISCFASCVDAAGPTLYTGNLQPVNSATQIPVKDFSILLTFSEAVQAGTAAVSITVRPCSFTDSSTCNGGSGCTWDSAATVCKQSTGTQKLHAENCRSGYSDHRIEFFNDVVLVPITTELGHNKEQHVNIPSTCFKGTDGETLAADYFATTYKFTTDVSERCSVSTAAPQRLSGDSTRKDTDTYVPLDPVVNSWVTRYPEGKTWTLYFSEAVQAGEGLIRIKETSGRQAETLVTEFTASKSWVKFKGAGKIELSRDAFGGKNGREYSLELRTGVFKDTHGNLAAASFTSTSHAYKVKVSTSFDTSVDGFFHN